MNTQQAREVIESAIRQIVPDADFGSLDETTNLRQEFELDSLDFLSVVESVSAAIGVPIAEEDYPAMVTLASGVDLIVRRTTAPAPAPIG